MSNSDLPKYIQRGDYVPKGEDGLTPRERDRYEKSEHMTLRGPGIIGGASCNGLARFEYCPNNLMETLIHRYNHHNHLLEKIDRLEQSLALWIAGKGVWAQILLGLENQFAGKWLKRNRRSNGVN